jgi:hypothetical protein
MHGKQSSFEEYVPDLHVQFGGLILLSAQLVQFFNESVQVEQYFESHY